MSQLSDFLCPGEVILISCCNLGRFGARYSLATLTAAGIGWLDLDDVIDPTTDIGIAGVAATEQSCFIALQGKRPRIVSLASDLRVKAQFESRRAEDLHSIAERDGVLYAASTGRNQILSIHCPGGDFRGEEQICFTQAESVKDTVHLNSVCCVETTLLFSMFGAKPNTGARYGAVIDAGSGATVHGRIMDPHSLTPLGDDVVGFCESLTSSFCLLDLGSGRVRKSQLSGYTRGCTYTGRHYVIGSSRWRHKSRSLGSLRDTPRAHDAHGNPWQRSSLFFVNPDLSVAHRLDFTHFAPEIYDIVYLGTRFTPANVFNDAAARRLDAMYDEIHGGASEPVRRYFKRA